LRTGGGFFFSRKSYSCEKKIQKIQKILQLHAKVVYTEQNYLWVLAVVFWSLPFLSGRGGQMLIVFLGVMV
jgi:hypothetical protein